MWKAREKSQRVNTHNFEATRLPKEWSSISQRKDPHSLLVLAETLKYLEPIIKKERCMLNFVTMANTEDKKEKKNSKGG